MKEVLTQQEIDSLLNALSAGEIDPEKIKKEQEQNKVKVFDFKRPNRLSRDHMDALYMIYENYAKIASNILSTQIRSNIQIKLGFVEQVTYEEFIHSIPNPTLIGLFHMEPLKGNLLIEINPYFGFQAVELLCGGSNRTFGRKNKFTDIEIGILQDMVHELLRAMETAWSDIIKVTPMLDTIETNPQLAQTMSPTEPVALFNFTVEMFGKSSFINLCIPYIALKDITHKLSIRKWFETEKKFDNKKHKKAITNQLLSAIVEVNVLLGKTTITVDDFLQLDIGDVVELNLQTTDPLNMYIEDKMHYTVQPGIYNKKLAVQILDIVEEDVEENEK